MSINDTYRRLTGNEFSTLNTTPQSYIPVPSGADYNKGYVVRKFVQKTNDELSPIFEVNSVELNRLMNSNIYIATSLRWRISGPVDPIIVGGRIIDKGIRESNKISIQLASTNISNLKLYLPNLIQFFK